MCVYDMVTLSPIIHVVDRELDPHTYHLRDLDVKAYEQ